MGKQENLNQLKKTLTDIGNDVVIERDKDGWAIKEIFYCDGFYLMSVKKNHDPQSIDLDDWNQRRISDKTALEYYDAVMEELEVNKDIYYVQS